MASYHRTQILLDVQQHSALTQIAQDEQRSLSELFREMAQDYLARKTEEQKKQQALLALKQLESLRKQIASRQAAPILDAVYQIQEVREDRAEELEQIQRGSE